MGKLVRSLWNPWRGCSNAGDLQASVPPCFQPSCRYSWHQPPSTLRPRLKQSSTEVPRKSWNIQESSTVATLACEWTLELGEPGKPCCEPSHYLGAIPSSGSLRSHHRWGQFRRRRPIATTRRSPWSISSHCFIDGWICMLVSCIHMVYISPFCTHTHIYIYIYIHIYIYIYEMLIYLSILSNLI